MTKGNILNRPVTVTFEFSYKFSSLQMTEQSLFKSHSSLHPLLFLFQSATLMGYWILGNKILKTIFLTRLRYPTYFVWFLLSTCSGISSLWFNNLQPSSFHFFPTAPTFFISLSRKLFWLSYWGLLLWLDCRLVKDVSSSVFLSHYCNERNRKRDKSKNYLQEWPITEVTLIISPIRQKWPESLKMNPHMIT